MNGAEALGLLAVMGTALVGSGVIGVLLICCGATDHEEDWEDRTW